jgi:1,4-alpha-glucan branching enzyme
MVLHAHLPLVYHPEHEQNLEELWLFEAITETYLPLLRIMENWLSDDIHFRLAVSISPTLSYMLSHPRLQERYRQHLKQLIGFAEKEVVRTHGWNRK